ncbi:MAG: hypothetical protein RIR90_1943 [Bacteroidota bacterium]
MDYLRSSSCSTRGLPKALPAPLAQGAFCIVPYRKQAFFAHNEMDYLRSSSCSTRGLPKALPAPLAQGAFCIVRYRKQAFYAHNAKRPSNFIGRAFVPRTGFEPAHPCGRCDLNTVRLPISPSGQINPYCYWFVIQGCKYITCTDKSKMFLNCHQAATTDITVIYAA